MSARRANKSENDNSRITRDNLSTNVSMTAMSNRERNTRNGSGNQIKPNMGRKDMRRYSFTEKNLRASGQRRILDLATCHEDSDEEKGYDDSENINVMKPLNETKMKASLRTREREARSTAESRMCHLFWYDGAAAILVILKHLITIESAVSTVLSTVTTWLLYNYHADWEARGIGPERNKPSSYGKSMGFLILSFFILMPITTLLRITFLRREEALGHISKMKACSMAIYTCHATWTWTIKDNTKLLNRLEHSDECLYLLTDFADTITRFLTLPMMGYPRHREMSRGRYEEELTMASAYSLFETAVSEYGTKIGLLTERMKKHGFSASEASRVRQSERMLLEAAESLREVKLYRTPQSMNAVITFFIVIGPAFYAPAFAQIGHDFGSVWFGIIYAAIISLSLTALYEAVKLMEDPFVCYITIDGIDVYEELSIVHYLQLTRARTTIFPNAPAFGASATNLEATASDLVQKRGRRSSVHLTRRCSTRFPSFDSLSNASPSASVKERRDTTQQILDGDLESGWATAKKPLEEVEEGTIAFSSKQGDNNNEEMRTR